MIDLSKVKGLADGVKGAIKQIADAAGNVLWKQAPSEATVTITGGVTSMRDDIKNLASVTINGTTYSDEYRLSETLVVPCGTEIHCVSYWGDYAGGGYVYVNGTQVAKSSGYDYGVSKAEYTYTVTGDASIKLERTNMYGNGGYWGSNVRITET